MAVAERPRPLSQSELDELAEDNELAVGDTPHGGEFIPVSDEPWDLPNFPIDVAQRVGKAIAELVISGEAETVFREALEAAEDRNKQLDALERAPTSDDVAASGQSEAQDSPDQDA